MRRFLVVGLGNFGSWTARELCVLGHEVIAVERNEELVDRHGLHVTRAVVGDGTDRRLLDEIGAETVDAAIVSTGEDLAASILITIALSDLGLKEIYVKVTSPEAARALEALRVKETIFPEQEAAHNLAHRIASRGVLKYVPLTRGYSLQELAIPDSWLGKTLRELALPQRHGIQIVAIYDVLKDEMHVVPNPDEPLKDSDVAIVAGSDEMVAKVLKGRRARG